MIFKKGMYRQMGMIKTPPHMTKKDRKDWWFEHAIRFKHLERMKWYTVLFTLEDNPFGAPPFDGYAEIWFESLDDLKQAFYSDTEQEALKHVREYGLFDPKYLQSVWAEEYVIELDYKSISAEGKKQKLTFPLKTEPEIRGNNITERSIND